jgi:hypothetical protein
VKKFILASCLAVAGIFAFSAPEALAGGGHHGHHHHGHYHGGHGVFYGGGHYHPGRFYGGPVYGSPWVGGYTSYYYSPQVVYRPYPVYPSYGYAPYYAYPSSSLFIGGRNFAFGISGF